MSVKRKIWTAVVLVILVVAIAVCVHHWPAILRGIKDAHDSIGHHLHG